MRFERDRHGRWRVELFRLPRWAWGLVALTVTGLIVAAARFVEPHPVLPGWLPGAIHLGGWAYLGLVLAAVAGWLMRQRKR